MAGTASFFFSLAFFQTPIFTFIFGFRERERERGCWIREFFFWTLTTLDGWIDEVCVRRWWCSVVEGEQRWLPGSLWTGSVGFPSLLPFRLFFLFFFPLRGFSFDINIRCLPGIYTGSREACIMRSFGFFGGLSGFRFGDTTGIHLELSAAEWDGMGLLRCGCTSSDGIIPPPEYGPISKE